MLLSLISIVFCMPVPANTWYVDVTAVPPGLGTSGSPYTSIAYALAQPGTLSGDTILVLPGDYYEAVDFAGKSVALVSTNGAAQTTLFGGTPSTGTTTSIRITSGENSSTRVQGFAIHNALGAPGGALVIDGSSALIQECIVHVDANPETAAARLNDCNVRMENCEFAGTHSSPRALSILDSTVQIVDSSFHSNGQSPFGGNGALYGQDSSLLIEGCDFYANATPFGGSHGTIVNCSTVMQNSTFRDGSAWLEEAGGLYLFGGNTVMTYCTIRDNMAVEWAGGIYSAGDLTVKNCVFENNSSFDEFPGGGIYHTSGSLRVADSKFTNCGGSDGGAIYVSSGSALIRGSEFRDNRVESFYYDLESSGGAISSRSPNVVVLDSLFVGNESDAQMKGEGGALFGPILASSCTFVNNTASHAGAATFDADVTESIAWNNLTAGSPADAVAGVTTVSYSVVEGGAPGAGNVTGDPLFWGSDDFHLLPGSSAINAGNPLSPLDSDGSLADSGAYPFDPQWCGEGCTGVVGSVSCGTFPNSTGFPAQLTGLGSTDIATNRLILNATGMPSDQIGYFLTTRTPDFIPFFGGSQGVLCLGGSLLRFNAEILFSGTQGAFSYRPDLLALPNGSMVHTGERWYFQAWYRDTLAGVGQSNTSSALAVDF